MAAFMLAVGLRGVVTRRPFLVSARWLLIVMLLGFLPNLILPFTFQTSRGGAAELLMRWAGPALFVVMAVMFWIIMRGQIVFGVTADSLRAGLFASLRGLELPHEETLGGVRLPTVPADLQVAVQSWVGTAQIKARDRAAAPVLEDVTRGMRAYFGSTAVHVNLTCCVFYVVVGVMLVGLDVALITM